MKVSRQNKSQSIELQRNFLKNLMENNPSKFKELAIMLKEYSKRGISLSTVYDRLSGNDCNFLFKLKPELIYSIKKTYRERNYFYTLIII